MNLKGNKFHLSLRGDSPTPLISNQPVCVALIIKPPPLSVKLVLNHHIGRYCLPVPVTESTKKTTIKTNVPEVIGLHQPTGKQKLPSGKHSP